VTEDDVAAKVIDKLLEIEHEGGEVLHHLVLLSQQCAMCLRQTLHIRQILPHKLLVIGGEVNCGHAVDTEADLLLEEVVSPVHQSIH
jgi:hypothetical protein